MLTQSVNKSNAGLYAYKELKSDRNHLPIRLWISQCAG